MVILDSFWEASIDDMKLGYVEENDCYVCLLCGTTIEKGIIYQEEGILYEAKKYASIHIEKHHGSVFDFIVNMEKDFTGLSDHQGNLLKLFYEGKNDKEIQKEMGIGSSSTIRNHRFTLKKKERQAKAFLALMELLKERDIRNTFATQPVVAVRKREQETDRVIAKVIAKYFEEDDNRLKTFLMKEKDRLVVLDEIVKHFELGEEYSEKEIDNILKGIYEDHTAVRRALIDYGFLERETDGSKYWVKDTIKQEQVEGKKRKKELKLEAKEVKTIAGVYQIKNTKNGKIFVESLPNLKSIEGRKFSLKYDSFMNKELQKDWNMYGEEAFTFEVLEEVDEEKLGTMDKKKYLKKLEEKWLEKLQPYGELGYNKMKK